MLQWYARDGEKMIGPIVDNICIGAKIVWEVAKDFGTMAVGGYPFDL